MNEDLRPRTKEFALRIIRMFTALPKSDVALVPGRQVLRSGTSVGANYREAYRARSRAEFICKVGDCLKEQEETAYWLELLVDSVCVTAAKASALLQETNELLAIFTTISKNTKARSGVTS
jgi:four helix bundle protein